MCESEVVGVSGHASPTELHVVVVLEAGKLQLFQVMMSQLEAESVAMGKAFTPAASLQYVRPSEQVWKYGIGLECKRGYSSWNVIMCLAECYIECRIMVLGWFTILQNLTVLCGVFRTLLLTKGNVVLSISQ